MTAKTPSGPDHAPFFILPLLVRIGRVREVVDRYDRLSGAAAATTRSVSFARSGRRFDPWASTPTRSTRNWTASTGCAAGAVEPSIWLLCGDGETETAAGAAAHLRALICLRSAGY